MLSKLALAGERPLLAKGATKVLPPVVSDLEGFVINLSGVQNEVTDNNVLSRNSALDGGVVLQLPSGSVTGNEVSVGRVALMVTAKASQGRRDLRIEGDSLAVTGPPPGGGQRAAAYALAIPTMTAGNYSILDNAMDGSVMIGAEPFASTGLLQLTAIAVALNTFVHVAHPIAFDGKSFSSAIALAGRRRSRSAPRAGPEARERRGGTARGGALRRGPAPEPDGDPVLRPASSAASSPSPAPRRRVWTSRTSSARPRRRRSSR